jgi:hypothetical protein
LGGLAYPLTTGTCPQTEMTYNNASLGVTGGQYIKSDIVGILDKNYHHISVVTKTPQNDGLAQVCTVNDRTW